MDVHVTAEMTIRTDGIRKATVVVLLGQGRGSNDFKRYAFVNDDFLLAWVAAGKFIREMRDAASRTEE